MSSQPSMKDDDGRSFVVKDGVWYHYGPAWWAMYGHAVLTGDVVGKAELAELEVLDVALIYEGKSTDERKAILYKRFGEICSTREELVARGEASAEPQDLC